MTRTLPHPVKLDGHQVLDHAFAKSLDTLQITPTCSESIHAADLLQAIPNLAAELRYILHCLRRSKACTSLCGVLTAHR